MKASEKQCGTVLPARQKAKEKTVHAAFDIVLYSGSDSGEGDRILMAAGINQSAMMKTTGFPKCNNDGGNEIR